MPVLKYRENESSLWQVVGITDGYTKKASITLSTDWIGTESPYTQTITIDGITVNSKVDLQPDSVVISQMIDDGTVAMYVANNNGVLTAYAVGEKPTAEMTIQVTVTEVSA